MKCTRHQCASGLPAEFDAIVTDPANESSKIVASCWCGICKHCKEEYELVAKVSGIEFVGIKRTLNDWVVEAECCFNCKNFDQSMVDEDKFMLPTHRCLKHEWKMWSHQICPDFISKNVLKIERNKLC